ncbi:MAG: leucyl/phenylalanyl-tRNA--protein transferase [Nitrospirota bacterium]
MPVFELSDKLIFPPPELSEDNGLLALGGNLTEARLLLAYSMGIFPWYSDDDPILWWSPDPRFVLFPEELKISRSLRQTIRKGTFQITIDKAFESVISKCASTHKKDDGGTWITVDMIEAYTGLHHCGHAHSVESWYEGKLVGGLYGVSMGSAFFGESMFSTKSDASKAAFVLLIQQLIKWNFTLIDCQIYTRHLISLGAREVPRSEFLARLKKALSSPSKAGIWQIGENV